jgi:Ni,Fe-hydrogenase III component G
MLLNLKTAVAKNKPQVETITAYFPGAEIYERELMDLLGVKIEGLSDGNRYPLTDDWPLDQHPLRKDWKPSIDKQNGGK